jgi:tetratricopeptide (TPR) repeat protein
MDSPVGQKIDRADRLMRLGEYERAGDLLEVLYEQNPDNGVIKNLLINCYEQTKNYSKMLMFLKRRLASEPPGYPLYRDIGRVYVLMGFPDSAASFFYAAAERVTDNDRAYGYIADIYQNYGHYKYGSDFIDSARVLTGDSTLLADRMGDALAAQRQFGAATMEYLNHMKEDTAAVRNTTRKLDAMMKFPESADTVMAVLSQQIESQTNNKYLLNTYGRLLLEQDRYDEAFEFFKGLDSLESGQGGSIIYFMRECNSRGKFDFTIKAGEYLLEYLPQSTLKNTTLFEMAEAMISTGKYQKALDLYQSVTEDLVRPAHRAEAKLKIGLLYKDYLNKPEEASKYLYDVIKSFPGGRNDTEARIGLADIAVKEQAFDSAISLYESLLDRDLPEDLKEEIEFSLAEIYLFQENYKESTAQFRRIISRYPRGFYVNDAIQYSLIISETLDEASKQIDLFSLAEYYRYTGQNDSLEYYLTKICRVGIPSLAPISYLRLAQLYYDQSRYDEAVEAVDSLEARYDQSYFLPYGLKLKADIRLQSPESREEALGLYRQLLEEYARYPFAAEIRDIIRHEMPADRI